jgi:hypothetical protein
MWIGPRKKNTKEGLLCRVLFMFVLPLFASTRFFPVVRGCKINIVRVLIIWPKSMTNKNARWL